MICHYIIGDYTACGIPVEHVPKYPEGTSTTRVSQLLPLDNEYIKIYLTEKPCSKCVENPHTQLDILAYLEL